MPNVTARIPTDEAHQDIINLVNELGIPQHLKGYNYIIYSVHTLMSHLNDPDYGITKGLYPTVGAIFNSTGSRVERAIRHAIDHLFLVGDWELIQEYFGNSINSSKGKLTNSQFLYALAYKVHRDRLEHS